MVSNLPTNALASPLAMHLHSVLAAAVQGSHHEDGPAQSQLLERDGKPGTEATLQTA